MKLTVYGEPCCKEIYNAQNEGIIDNNNNEAGEDDKKFEGFNLVKFNPDGDATYFLIHHCPFCGTALKTFKE
jgi:hypothetical protein